MLAKLTRHERKIARDASLRSRGKVYQTHCHVCTCTKRWLCKLDHGLPKSGKDVLCVQCAEKKRAIEAELNSGQQMQINFEPESFWAFSWTAFDKLFIQNLKDNLPYSTLYKNPNLVKEDSYWAKPPKSPYPGKLSEPGTGVNSGNALEVIDTLNPYVKYDIKYSVQYVNSKDEIVSGADPSLGKSPLQDSVKTTVLDELKTAKRKFDQALEELVNPKPIEVKG